MPRITTGSAISHASLLQFVAIEDIANSLNQINDTLGRFNQIVDKNSCKFLEAFKLQTAEISKISSALLRQVDESKMYRLNFEYFELAKQVNHYKENLNLADVIQTERKFPHYKPMTKKEITFLVLLYPNVNIAEKIRQISLYTGETPYITGKQLLRSARFPLSQYHRQVVIEEEQFFIEINKDFIEPLALGVRVTSYHRFLEEFFECDYHRSCLVLKESKQVEFMNYVTNHITNMVENTDVGTTFSCLSPFFHTWQVIEEEVRLVYEIKRFRLLLPELENLLLQK